MPLNRLCLGIAASSMLGPAPDSSAQTACDAGLDRDGLVSGADLALVLGDWGFCKKCTGDITGDDAVDGVDLAIVLSRWSDDCTVPEWATLVGFYPDPDVIYDEELRASINAMGLPSRIRDAATGIEIPLVPPGSFEMRVLRLQCGLLRTTETSSPNGRGHAGVLSRAVRADAGRLDFGLTLPPETVPSRILGIRRNSGVQVMPGKRFKTGEIVDKLRLTQRLAYMWRTRRRSRLPHGLAP